MSGTRTTGLRRSKIELRVRAPFIRVGSECKNIYWDMRENITVVHRHERKATVTICVILDGF